MNDGGRGSLLNIISARVLLSFSYGFLNVLLSLYLHYIGYSFLEIGLILTGAILINSLMSFSLGMVGDRLGRKFTLIGLFIMFSVSSFLFLSTKNPLILMLMSGIGGFTGSGGGPIGSGGPFGAIQTALITEFTKREKFSATLSIASVIGIAASSGGSFLIELFEHVHIDVYLLFYLSGVLGLAGAIVSVWLKDRKVRSKNFLPKISWRNIIKLAIPTIPNGVGSGFISPIFSLWFHIRFGLTSGQIGVIFGLSNIVVILTMLILPRITRPETELKAIVGTRLISSLALILLAFSPFLIVTSALYALRQGTQMGAVPIRQSFSLGIVHEAERATSSGATSMTRTGFSSVSPPFAGSLLSLNSAYPPFIAGLITLADPALYYFLFKKTFRRK
ncbi:MAG: MFS transporter [Thermoplasmatales archaeon]